ncbi:hypothetical protein FHL15_005275 [Xylaria flabelliformis]|uniref:Uncharacterized protein n=1 Tax=Xylaria flabelliformis TaxID=2512241 RepID=A0A553I114_9PEZI|nr:hypothetical protein FHL15_005275 [Xylaria flabelliformis]
MMPGLTLNTEAAVPRASQQQQQQQQLSTNRTSTSTASGGGNPPTRTFHSTTPIPVPIPYTSREQPPQPSPRSSSPVRPTYSPITPPLNATAFPPRPTYTHNSHVDATAVPAPPPEPIDFHTNPDVLALKSAISILQMQRRKAERDMAALDRVKSAALAEPEAFVRDLTTGRARVEGEGLFVGSVKDRDDDSDSSSGSGSDNEGDRSKDGDDETKHIKSDPTPRYRQATQEKPNIKADPDVERPGPPPWTQIPKPQNVVRCPPINWSQYAVVGESLDKLHNEQMRRPAQGTPATLTPEGRFEFKGGDGKQEPYMGVAAPYAPGKDKIDGKSKIPSKR